MQISVVIPTHNRLDLLEKALKSIYAQTILPDELIVVDDGSEPSVTEGIFEGAPETLNTWLLRHEAPKGAPESRNAGVKKATGEWIAFLDDDDAFSPNKIELIRQCIRDNTDIDVIYHPAMIHMVGLNVSYRSKPLELKPTDNAFALLYAKNLIGGTSMVVVKKQSLINAGLFSKNLPALQDLDLWLKLARADTRFYLLNEPLTDYHFYTGKKSITKNIEARDQALFMINEKFKEEIASVKNIYENKNSERYLKSNVFIALINMQKKEAFLQQMKLFRHSLRLKDFLLLLVIPFGSKWVFRLRSYL